MSWLLLNKDFYVFLESRLRTTDARLFPAAINKTNEQLQSRMESLNYICFIIGDYNGYNNKNDLLYPNIFSINNANRRLELFYGSILAIVRDLRLNS